jgi:hypothetical protein
VNEGALVKARPPTTMKAGSFQLEITTLILCL